MNQRLIHPKIPSKFINSAQPLAIGVLIVSFTRCAALMGRISGLMGSAACVKSPADPQTRMLIPLRVSQLATVEAA